MPDPEEQHDRRDRPAVPRPLTRADLGDLPDDGHRYELIDGTLIVSPGPAPAYQDVVGSLHLLLRAACPADLEVVLAPSAVALAGDTEARPDLLGAPRAQSTRTELRGWPAARRRGALPEHPRGRPAAQARPAAGHRVRCSWLADPDGPSVTVLELRDGAYVEVGRAVGSDRLRVTRLVPVELVPGRLLH